MRIAINAGHCPGIDSGAVGPTGLQEADVAKNISQLIVSILKSEGHNALFIQKDSLYDIATTSNDFTADLFISIHCNAADNTEARGTETFHHPVSERGAELAGCIQKQIISAMGTADRGVKEANFHVLKYTHAPACLVETEFISNAEGECMLGDPTKHEGLARAIVAGINDYAR